MPKGAPGKTEPSKASWLIWTGLDVVVAFGMYMEGALNAQIVAVLIGASIAIFFVMRYGITEWTGTDKFCLIGGVVGMGLILFSNPLLGLITSLVIMCLGSIPTFISVWKDPGRENKLAWMLFAAGSICSVATIPKWTLADAAQPITFLAVQIVVLGISYGKPR